MNKTTIFQLVIIVLLVVILGIIIIAGQTGGDSQTDQNGTSTTEQDDEIQPRNPQATRDFAESVSYNITGIEPGAGVMQSTETAIEEYQLEEWNLQQSSASAMLTALQEAFESEEPIVATVWQPHSSFAVGDLRKLEDPKNIYNDPEATKAFLDEHASEYADADVQSDVLASVVYSGFAEDAPAANEFFGNFNVSAETQSEWIYQYSVEDVSAENVASQYLSNNPDKVDEWTSVDSDLGKQSLTLGLPPWPGATVKSHIAKQLLEDIGYTVELNELDAGVVYTSLADQELDATVAGWLPTTHQDYWNRYGDQLEIAGVNVTQTWLGLGVPDHVNKDIQSLSDLKVIQE